MVKQYIIRTATKPRRYYYRDAEGSWQTSAKLAKADRFAIRAAHEAYRTIVPVLLPEDPMDAQLAGRWLRVLGSQSPGVVARR